MRAGMTAALALVMLASCASEPEETTTTRQGTTTSTATTTTTAPATTTSEAAATTTPETMGVMVFHKTTGFRHDSIPAGIEAIRRLGDEHGFEVEESDDAARFNPDDLASYRVVVFLNTTGEVLDEAQQQAMEEFIRAGNGFVGIHSATDTEYDWPWYGGLVGAYFDSHPAVQSAQVTTVAADHPVMDGFPAELTRTDEWYDFRSHPDPSATVLATIDEASYEGGNMGDPHPIAWAHEYEGGRSFYTGFGHTPETFAEPEVLTMLGNAILWASGEG